MTGFQSGSKLASNTEQ